jgi:hypothetical protein
MWGGEGLALGDLGRVSEADVRGGCQRRMSEAALSMEH